MMVVKRETEGTKERERRPYPCLPSGSRGVAGIEGASCPGWNKSREIESTGPPRRDHRPTRDGRERPKLQESETLVHQNSGSPDPPEPLLTRCLSTRESYVRVNKFIVK